MGFISLLMNISPALEAGKTLENARGWSNVANATHALIVVFGFLLVVAKVFNYDIPLSDDQIAKLAGAVASVGGTVAGIVSIASNPHAGIIKK